MQLASTPAAPPAQPSRMAEAAGMIVLHDEAAAVSRNGDRLVMAGIGWAKTQQACAERVEKVAPFLYLDSDPYAVTSGETITWMVNGLTTTNEYPYSQRRIMGDKATVRTEFPRLHRPHNYVRDAVKCTVDAATVRGSLSIDTGSGAVTVADVA